MAWRKRDDRVLISFFGGGLILVRVTTVVMHVRRVKVRGEVEVKKRKQGGAMLV